MGRGLAGAALTCAIVLLALPATASAANFAVDDAGDAVDANAGNGICATATAVCTLRAAIEEANALAGADSISFDVGTEGDPATIVVDPPAGAPGGVGELPAITEQLTIDGATQCALPGCGENPKIEIDGNHATDGAGTDDALNFAGGTATDGSIVRGLIINNAEDVGIRLANILSVFAVGITIEGNWIGPDSDGLTTTNPNGTDGITVLSEGNTIGGDTAAERNVISGNTGAGVLLLDGNNTVKGNYIGTDKDGEGPLGNGVDGIAFVADDNVIGGSAAGEGNVISGNTNAGILVSELAGTVTGNAIKGNRIGTTANGSSPLPNQHGIVIEGDNTEVGGTQANEGNLISAHDNLANDGKGILVDGGLGSVAEHTNIVGNLIGTNSGGTLDVGNDIGIFLDDRSDDTTIGGATAAERNVISGNGGFVNGHGIFAELNSSNVTIQGNFIGTTAAGTTGLGNQIGMRLEGMTGTNAIGGDAPGEGNVISDNPNGSVTVSGASGTLEIQGNRIGTSADGMTALGNGDGVRVENPDPTSVTIGGSTPGAGNLVAASHGAGIRLQSSTDNTVQGNLIGTDATGGGTAALFGNGQTAGHGIFVQGQDNVIGGTGANETNTIANTQNGGDGVFVADTALGAGNPIRGNSIFNNGGLGIDLDPDGVTPNNPQDADGSPNNLQNFPVLTSASRTASTVNVAGTLNSTPSVDDFLIDVYASTSCDPSGNGEGQFYVGSTMVDTDINGNGAFNVSLPTTSPAAADQITATATAPVGIDDTSEFSACFVPPAPPSPGPTPLAPVVLPGNALLALDSAKLKKNKIPVKIACQAGGPACVGTCELKTAGPVTLAAIAAKKKRKKKVVPLGSASFSIPAGQSGIVRVKVPKRGRKLFKKRRKVRATATITTTRGAGRTVTDSLLVKKPKEKKREK